MASKAIDYFNVWRHDGKQQINSFSHENDFDKSVDFDTCHGQIDIVKKFVFLQILFSKNVFVI